VDGHDARGEEPVVQRFMNQSYYRSNLAQVFKLLGDVGPADGMYQETLVGLAATCWRTWDDPKAIGPAMAVALLTTLYVL